MFSSSLHLRDHVAEIATDPAVRQEARALSVRYVFVGALEKRDFGPSAFPLRANFRRAFMGNDAAVFEILK